MKFEFCIAFCETYGEKRMGRNENLRKWFATGTDLIDLEEFSIQVKSEGEGHELALFGAHTSI